MKFSDEEKPEGTINMMSQRFDLLEITRKILNEKINEKK